MHEGCKGCRDEKTLCSKQYIKPVCPCTSCLIKPMCVISCELLKVFISENIEELTHIHSKWSKEKNNKS